MQFTQFVQQPGAIANLVPEGVRKYKLFQYVMPLMEDLFINDVRKVIYDKFDGFWDPLATPEPLLLGRFMTGMSQDDIKSLFTTNGSYKEDKLRMFLYYLPVDASSMYTLQWYSTMVFLMTGQLNVLTSGDGCSLVINVPEGDEAKAEEARKILKELIEKSKLLCTDVPPPITVKPTPDPITPPGC